MRRAPIIVLGLLTGTAAFLGGFAAYPDNSSRVQEDDIDWNCHTDGNEICGPTFNSDEIARRADIARDMLRPQNAQYNHYITGGTAGIYALDDIRRIRAELGEDSPYVHDELIEGCEGDWTDPFCDIVRHYQDLRINLGSSLGSEDRG